MEIRRGDIVIRDMRASDIADHMLWHTVDIEWMNWDAPWRQDLDQSPAELHLRLQSLATAAPPPVRTRFEIDTDSGEHIGWMNSYRLDGSPGRIAIGIDIAHPRWRGAGRGEKAFSCFIHYLFSAGLPCVYTETWSGNLPMIRLAGKCGFTLVNRTPQSCPVEGRAYDGLLFCVTPEDFYARQTFPPTPDVKRPLSRCGWALFALIFCAQLAAAGLTVLLNAVSPAVLSSTYGLFGISALAIYGLGLPVFMFILRRVPAADLPSPATPPDTGTLVRLLISCVGMGYLGQLAGSIVIIFLEQLTGHGYVNILDTAIDLSSPIPVFLFTVVLAPVFEELIFRRLLLRRLLPYGDEFAITATAIAFALFHCNVGQFFYAYTVGAILAYTVIITGRLHYSILLHGCFNLIGSLLLPQLLSADDQWLATVTALILLAVMAASIILFIHRKNDLHFKYGTLPLSEGQKRQILLRSPGVIAFILLTLALTAWTFLS